MRDAVADPGGSGLALADGLHLVAACHEHGMRIRTLLLSDAGAALEVARELAARCAAEERLILSDALFCDLTGVKAPVGIAAVFEIPAPGARAFGGDVVLLEAVQDAGNVGAILRTAAAAGVGEVLLGPGCAGAWNVRVLRAAQGAHFRLSIREQVDLETELAATSALPIATVAHGGTSLYELELTGPLLWLLGNEGAGLSVRALAITPMHARIPVAAGTESLNVAAAAAVCLFEAVRQRRTKEKGPHQAGP